jgi:hypothetical protein
VYCLVPFLYLCVSISLLPYVLSFCLPCSELLSINPNNCFPWFFCLVFFLHAANNEEQKNFPAPFFVCFLHSIGYSFVCSLSCLLLPLYFFPLFFSLYFFFCVCNCSAYLIFFHSSPPFFFLSICCYPDNVVYSLAKCCICLLRVFVCG